MKRKLHAGLLTVTILALSSALSLAADVKNGSFEDADPSGDNVYGDRAEHWGRWGNWINRETGWSPVRTGKCIIGYHHWEIAEKDNSGLYQDIEGVPANKKVTFSIYASKDEKANNEKVELRLEPFNGGKTIASQFYTLDEINTGWTQLTVSGTTADKGGVRVLVICYPKQSDGRDGALRFDDAELKEE
jgi:hypothetical protein